MDMSWPPLGHVVEYAGSVATGRQRERLQRRAIRKSESLNALAKAHLKYLSNINTIGLAIEQLGLIFILPTIVYLVATAWFTVFLVETAQIKENRKAKRDDAV